MRGSGRNGFTLVEVLIALALSAAIFAAALNLLLGIVGAWEKARAGDLRADEDFRLFSFLRTYLETSDEEGLEVRNLPGDRGEMWLTFSIENSPLTRALSEEWSTEKFALVTDRDAIRLVPVVGDQEDRPRIDDGLALFSEGVELEYWNWDEDRERWEDVERLEARGVQEVEVPRYLLVHFPDETIRWIKLGNAEGDLALW
ncbi:prepilin-type N-terminal cleavage/methylation domain-containing protein [Puniceicoccus vermicola]|uniref:Prepilin-type N-terminal cleavage/methylation domain-containing protein n=1 Tax=Puniceicoccus vermicola TaxID=388746 RepID=A0A7X1E5G4_9BACT|nr:prepilin-type N-terminal cleavage/methylation domain-containing protein [Puniceicoccus vermicola]MBC2603109.1 prepilin-type N-terminal cleavage/methylation domain-containing protein [Puniceicoccus vermicola]